MAYRTLLKYIIIHITQYTHRINRGHNVITWHYFSIIPQTSFMSVLVYFSSNNSIMRWTLWQLTTPRLNCRINYNDGVYAHAYARLHEKRCHWLKLETKWIFLNTHENKYAYEHEIFHERDFTFHENFQVLFHTEYGLYMALQFFKTKMCIVILIVKQSAWQLQCKNILGISKQMFNNRSCQ